MPIKSLHLIKSGGPSYFSDIPSGLKSTQGGWKVSHALTKETWNLLVNHHGQHGHHGQDLTCLNQGDPEPPGDPGHKDAVAEDEAMHKQLHQHHTAEEHNTPTTLR